MNTCIPNIRVQNANMMAGNAVISAAQPLGIVLFAHALCMKSGAELKRVAIMYHDVQPLGERGAVFNPHQRRGASLIDENDYARGTFSLSLQPVAEMHCEVSVLVESTDALNTRSLVGGRLLGGAILSHGRIQASSDIDRLFLPNGFWLCDRRDLVDPSSPLSSALEAVSNKKNPWVSLSSVGYSLTTPLEERSGVRATDDGAVPLHAFCEPLIGLTQFVSSRSLRQPPYWAEYWLRDDVFAVRGQLIDVNSSEKLNDDELEIY